MNKDLDKYIMILIVVALSLIYVAIFNANILNIVNDIEYEEREATVTGFNTIPSQTDSRPCESANGENICGLDNVIACPTDLEFNTMVKIEGKTYRCVDRMARKYGQRFDISFDKDIEGAREFGKQHLLVTIIK